MYVALCFNKPYMKKKLGEKIDKIEKFFAGFLLMLLVIILIVGPLLLFSNLTSLPNQIKSTSANL
jgi:hypothetical protein